MKIEGSKIITIKDKPYFREFNKLISNDDILKKIHSFEVTDIDYSNKVSSVYSSNIEGNLIDLNSYMRIVNSQSLKLKKEKSIIEIENIKEGYMFAQKNKLTIKNFLKSHKIMSKNLKIARVEKGNWRVGEEEAIYGDMGIVYIALETKYVKKVMESLFDEISQLLKQKLEANEILYYSAWIHFLIAKIHPFRDGNGRIARLVQKWFISEFLGEIAWKIPFESYFKKHQNNYYENLDIGVNFYESDFQSKKVLDFLTMSIKALK